MEHLSEQSTERMTLEAFHQEIARLKETGTDGHFRAIKPEELGQQELETYEKYQKETLSMEDFEEIRRTYTSGNIKGLMEDDSRGNFYAWIGNQLWVRDYRRKHESPES